MIAQNAPHNLAELVKETLALTGNDAKFPTVVRICFAERWAIIELSDGRCGRAFTFNGQHSVYGSLDFERMRSMRSLIGTRCNEALTLLFAEADRIEHSGKGDFAAKGAHAALSLTRSVILAIVNALSCNLNAPCALEARGFGITASDDRSFLHAEDAVVLIGAGILLKESATMCASVDVVDMRPRAALQTLLLDADGERQGPRNVQFHDVEDTESLVARADVIGITGCALENESLFDIARMPRRAREFIVFGPSAQIPMEIFSALGVTRVVASRITDVKSLTESMLAKFDVTNPRAATEGYVVTMPHGNINCKE